MSHSEDIQNPVDFIDIIVSAATPHKALQAPPGGGQKLMSQLNPKLVGNDQDEPPTAEIANKTTKMPSVSPVNPKKKIMVHKLREMGWTAKRAIFLCFETDFDTIEQAVEYMSPDPTTKIYRHPFIEDEETSGYCLICLNNDKTIHQDFKTGKNEAENVGELYKNALEKRNSGPKNQNLANGDKTGALPIQTAASTTAEVCLVCYTPCPTPMTWKGKTHGICQSCFDSYMTTEIKSGKVEKLACPHCNEIFDEETLKLVVSAEIFQKYLTFQRNLEVARDPLARYCPNTTCSKIVRLQTKEDLRANCEFCKTEICAKCSRNFHGETPCDEIMKKELKEWTSHKDVSKCPKCRMIVEKSDGCNHMSCPVCTYEWCWLCGSGYTSLHFSPFNPLGCPGLQSGTNQASQWGFCKRTLYRLAMLILLILAFPLGVVFGFAIWFVFIIDEHADMEDLNCCLRVTFWVLLFILGMVLNCVVAPLGLVALPFVGIYFLIAYCHKRYKMTRRFEQRLAERDMRRLV